MIQRRVRESGLPTDSLPAGREHPEPWVLLQKCVLFTAMPITDCRAIAAMARERNFDPRQVIFAEGEPIHEVLLIRTGSIKLVQTDNKAREVILGLCGAYEVVGAIGAAAGSPHRCSAQAVEAGSALAWDCESFDDTLDRYPVMRKNIMRILFDRICEIEQRFRELATERVADRVAHELVRLLGHIGKPIKGAMEVNLSREELAQITGTTLFTVSRLLSNWQQGGIVTARRGGIAVHDPDQLLNRNRRAGS